MSRKTLLWVVVPLGFLLLACNTINQLASSTTATPSPFPTATPTSTVTPVPTPTITPTPQPEARVSSGDLAVFYGDWSVALEEFQAALDVSSDPEVRGGALLGLGRTHYLMDAYDRALGPLRTVIETYPNTSHLADAYFYLGQTYTGLGRFADAEEAYMSYLSERPGVIDHFIHERRGDALVASGDPNGAIEAYRAALEAPHSGDVVDLSIKLARSHAAAGDYNTALDHYQQVLNATGNDFIKAQMDLLSGQAHLALGETDAAFAAYLHAVENYPRAFDSYTALVALVEAGVPVDEIDRGLVDYFAGQYGVAIAAFDRHLNSTSSLENAATARYFKGLSLRALQDNESAIGQWDEVIQAFPADPYWDDAWEQKAYTQWAWLDRHAEAVDTLLTFVETVPDHPRAAEFLLDAARVSERGGLLEEAALLGERLAFEYPLSDFAFEGMYLAGVSRFRAGDPSTALGTFQRSLELATEPAGRAASLLWIGKCENALGDPFAARGSWEKAATADPTGYYSERARDLLLERRPFSPPLAYDLTVDKKAELSAAEAWLRATFPQLEGQDLSGLGTLGEDPRIQRGTELWHLGMYEAARGEFEALRLAIASDPGDTYRLANYLTELGVYRSGIFAARRVLDLAVMDDASTMNAPAHFNHIRFGTYYSDLVLPLAQAYEFHPLFLFSVIRQESLFEGFVRSSAGARGLMQIIPSTGQSIFALNGWPPDYSVDDLYRPKVNLTYGTDYLHDQRSRFEGDIYAALAAYNGGPGNASVWKNLAPDDPDLYLEVVRFNETQTYIKRIYEIFSIYRRLYDRSP
jgi:soluble lytic murein transglycosylase